MGLLGRGQQQPITKLDVYFITDSVQKLLDMHLCLHTHTHTHTHTKEGIFDELDIITVCTGVIMYRN
jgi:hypothetical protein